MSPLPVTSVVLRPVEVHHVHLPAQQHGQPSLPPTCPSPSHPRVQPPRQRHPTRRQPFAQRPHKLFKPRLLPQNPSAVHLPGAGRKLPRSFLVQPRLRGLHQRDRDVQRSGPLQVVAVGEYAQRQLPYCPVQARAGYYHVSLDS